MSSSILASRVDSLEETLQNLQSHILKFESLATTIESFVKKQSQEILLHQIETPAKAESIEAPIVSVVADAAPIVADAAPIVADAAPIVADVAPIVADVAPIVADAAPIVADVAPIVADAAPIVADAAPIDADAAPIDADAAPITTGEVGLSNSGIHLQEKIQAVLAEAEVQAEIQSVIVESKQAKIIKDVILKLSKLSKHQVAYLDNYFADENDENVDREVLRITQEFVFTVAEELAYAASLIRSS